MQAATAIDGIFYVCILIMSVVIHEFAHGYSAYLLGDKTAQLSGRLTLNPLKHLDPFGSFILPLLLIISKAGFVIGWARPVPYNPNNLKSGRRGTFIVAIAGILANISIAVIFSMLLRFAPTLGVVSVVPDDPFFRITATIIFTNLVLALFNLIPIPPLDGSKILFSILPHNLRFIEDFLEQWGMFILLFFIIFLWGKFAPIIYWAFSVLTGLS